ncbi:MAG: glycine betaine ABC transporter substrate-binding protein, partial [Vagococcus sp.]
MKKKLVILSLGIVLLLSACSLPGLGNSKKSDDRIAIGSMATSENQILANLVKQMIEHYTDEEVVMINNLGTSTVAHNAMVNG